MPRASSRRSRKRERTRGEILAAAARLCVDRDLAELSVESICQEADVARATFFLHFEAKTALIAAWERQLAARLAQPLQAGRPRVARCLRAVVEVLWESPGVSRCVILDGLKRTSPSMLEARVAGALVELVRAGELRRGARPALLARVWLASAAAALSTPEGRCGDAALREELLRTLQSGAAAAKPRLKWAPSAAGAPRSV